MTDETREPTEPVYPRLVQDLPWIIGAFFLAFACFFATMASGLTWKNYGSDGGELALAIAFWGVAHPSGYPFYILLGQLFRILPFGGVAFRTNLLSVVGGALAAAACVWILRQMTRRFSLDLPDWSVFCIGLCIALGRTLWSQCVITEVYSLHVALNLWVLAFLLAWNHSVHCRSPRGGVLVIAGLIWACSLGVHLTSAFLFPAFSYLIYCTDSGIFRKTRFWIGFLACVVVVCALYGLLLWRATFHTPVNWGNLKSLSDLVNHVSGQQYLSRAFSLSWKELALGLFSRIIPLFLFQWGVGSVSLLFAGTVFGIWLWFNFSGDMRGAFRQAVIVWFLLWVPVSAYSANYRIHDFEVYFALPFTILGFLLPMGLSGLQVLLKNGMVGNRLRIGISTLFHLALLVGALGNAASVGLAGDAVAEEYAREVFSNLPENSLIISDFDGQTNALLYARSLLFPERKNVLIVVRTIIGDQWYLDQIRENYPELNIPPLGSAPAGMPWNALCKYLAAKIISINPERPTYLVKDNFEITGSLVPVMENRLLRLVPPRRRYLPSSSFGKFFPVPIERMSNADYRGAVFQPPNPMPEFISYFSLGMGIFLSPGNIPFWILPPKVYSGVPSVVLTSQVDPQKAFLPLIATATRMLHLAGIGLNTKNLQGPVATMTIHYQSGNPEAFAINPILDLQISDYNSFDYVRLKLDETRIPIGISLAPVPSQPSSGTPPAIAIFSMTQELQ